jgi:hypothetical protein
MSFDFLFMTAQPIPESVKLLRYIQSVEVETIVKAPRKPRQPKAPVVKIPRVKKPTKRDIEKAAAAGRRAARALVYYDVNAPHYCNKCNRTLPAEMFAYRCKAHVKRLVPCKECRAKALERRRELEAMTIKNFLVEP